MSEEVFQERIKRMQIKKRKFMETIEQLQIIQKVQIIYIICGVYIS